MAAAIYKIVLVYKFCVNIKTCVSLKKRSSSATRNKDVETLKKSLLEAIRNDDIQLLKCLLSTDPEILDIAATDWSENPIIKACKLRSFQVVEEIRIRKPEFARLKDDRDGCSLLHTACVRGDVEMVRVLLGLDSRLCFARDMFSMPPLHTAVIHGRLDVIKALLSASSESLGALGSLGQTVFHLAARYHHSDAFAVLLEEAKPHRKHLLYLVDHQGNSALDIAVNNKLFPDRIVEKLLLSLNCDSADVNLNTPEIGPNLHEAESDDDPQAREIPIDAENRFIESEDIALPRFRKFEMEETTTSPRSEELLLSLNCGSVDAPEIGPNLHEAESADDRQVREIPSDVENHFIEFEAINLPRFCENCFIEFEDITLPAFRKFEMGETASPRLEELLLSRNCDSVGALEIGPNLHEAESEDNHCVIESSSDAENCFIEFEDNTLPGFRKFEMAETTSPRVEEPLHSMDCGWVDALEIFPNLHEAESEDDHQVREIPIDAENRFIEFEAITLPRFDEDRYIEFEDITLPGFRKFEMEETTTSRRFEEMLPSLNCGSVDAPEIGPNLHEAESEDDLVGEAITLPMFRNAQEIGPNLHEAESEEDLVGEVIFSPMLCSSRRRDSNSPWWLLKKKKFDSIFPAILIFLGFSITLILPNIFPREKSRQNQVVFQFRDVVFGQLPPVFYIMTLVTICFTATTLNLTMFLLSDPCGIVLCLSGIAIFVLYVLLAYCTLPKFFVTFGSDYISSSRIMWILSLGLVFFGALITLLVKHFHLLSWYFSRLMIILLVKLRRQAHFIRRNRYDVLR